MCIEAALQRRQTGQECSWSDTDWLNTLAQLLRVSLFTIVCMPSSFLACHYCCLAVSLSTYLSIYQSVFEAIVSPDCPQVYLSSPVCAWFPLPHSTKHACCLETLLTRESLLAKFRLMPHFHCMVWLDSLVTIVLVCHWQKLCIVPGTFFLVSPGIVPCALDILHKYSISKINKIKKKPSYYQLRQIFFFIH